MRRQNISFPDEALDRFWQAHYVWMARGGGNSFSEFVREALREKIEREKLDRTP